MTDPFATPPKPRLVIPARPDSPSSASPTAAPAPAPAAAAAHAPAPRPVPRPPGPGSFARRFPAAPDLGLDRDPDAVYVLDTGVGTAFACVNRLDLLVDHYGDQLRYVDSVVVEWRNHARSTVRPLENGHTPADKADHVQLSGLKLAGARLLRTATSLFGPPIVTTVEDQEAIDVLVGELCALDPPKDVDLNDDRGECASVHVGLRLRASQGGGQRVVVVCANDGRAKRLANSRGLGHRNMHTVLREMVRGELLSSIEAYELYERMATVTKLPEDVRPTSADDFA